MNNFLSIIVVLLLFSIKNYAQTDTCVLQIEIKSLIEPRQKLLIHLEIWLDNKKITQIDQVSNHCFINISKEGEYKFIISSKGYLTKIDSLQLSCNVSDIPVIELTPISLENLNIKDGIDKNEAREIAMEVFKLKNISSIDIVVKEGYHKTIPVWECQTSYQSNHSKILSNTTKHLAIDKSTGKVLNTDTSITRKAMLNNKNAPASMIKE